MPRLLSATRKKAKLSDIKETLSLMTCSYFFCIRCEKFEPRSHFIRRLNMLFQVSIVLNRTVVDSDLISFFHFDNLCGSNLQSQSDLYHIN